MVNLLWTGGWDSTFRLLQLAAAGSEIQPHYIRDTNRDSLEKEIQVMRDIRQRVNEKFPKTFIRNIEIIDLPDINVCADFKQAHQNLLARGWIGDQYIFIASYCRQYKIENLELSLERLHPGRRAVMPSLENTENNVRGYRVISSAANNDLLCLFGQFSFPILSLTKLDMLENSKESDFLDILNMTWFCHQPFFGKPCGSCNPCMSTLEEGLRYRFSTLSLARYRLKKFLMSHSKLHLFLRKLKYGSTDYS